ncbi:MAG: 2-hydroxyglutaryl-CoA dehydratase [Candidatus Hydrogenedentes bacterium]|nr:2-hydroxyglutaryl-CoA dehydratase [Candidatus Hydrogenedentota bacterium]
MIVGDLFAGVDAGSATTKAVVVDGAGTVLANAVLPSGARLAESSARVLEEALARAGAHRGRVAAVVSTGYGREMVEGRTRAVTEITCHARGVQAMMPEARGVIDIGGQDSKAIALENGAVRRFEMNDKCAAGTGRFLEVMARTLEVPLDGFGPLALESTEPARLSNTCTVFAESEVISLLAQGRAPADILAGVCRAVAGRAAALAARVRLSQPCAMTGGVALNAGVVRYLGEALGFPVVLPAMPQTAGALGAALIARDLA